MYNKMSFFTVQNRVNLVYAVGAGYTLVTTSVAWLFSMTVNKLITDSCNNWITSNNSTNKNGIKEFLSEASKQELCKWAPFITDGLIITGTFQVFGMGLYGADFKVTNLAKAKYGTAGFSGYLMSFVNDQQENNSPFSFAGDLTHIISSRRTSIDGDVLRQASFHADGLSSSANAFDNEESGLRALSFVIDIIDGASRNAEDRGVYVGSPSALGYTEIPSINLGGALTTVALAAEDSFLLDIASN